MSSRNLCCGVLLVAVSSPLAAQVATPRPAAVVNGEAIPAAEVEALLRRQPPPANPLTAAQRRDMEQHALDMLIDDTLMRQFLAKHAPAIPAEEINKEVLEFQQVLAKEKQTLQQFLRDNYQTEAQLRADITARLQWQAYIKPRLPDNVVKQYYDANKPFFDREMVRASHILVKLPVTAPANERQLAFTRLTALRQEILAGKTDFATAARKHSDCPSKENGGDIDYFPYKFAVPDAFAKAAFSLKVGAVSEVIATEHGLHVLRVTDKKAGEASKFDAIKEDVRMVYAQEVYQAIVVEQRRTAKIDLPPR
jgi:parvulin-like peptidyl-prolyl isomerase